jgi:nucleoside-diphosphate-sugar epimerase
MRVLVTGSEGYIGARLVPILIAHGLDVVGLDTGFYRDGWLYSDNKGMPVSASTIAKDLRHVDDGDLKGVDAVVHLAELSNDPLGQNNPAVTHEINHRASVSLAEKARRQGVGRFVYTSSCSVYGAGTGDFLDETSATNPQTAYAECKLLVERDLSAMAEKGFAPVFLRNATAFGPSPRMRFDIVINDLCALAWTTKRIAMISDGSPWRPVVHVDDICHAVYCSLVAPAGAVTGRVFNVGQNSANYRVRELAEIVGREFPGCEVTMGPPSGDTRSYRVNFDRVHRELPGFECRFTASDGARQLRQIFERLQMPTDIYQFRAFTRLKQLKYLQATGQVDSDLYWT